MVCPLSAGHIDAAMTLVPDAAIWAGVIASVIGASLP